MELLFRDDAYLQECEAEVLSADETGIRLTRTVFYPMGGGQPGDQGVLLRTDGSEIPIVDTRKGESHEDVVHIPEDGAALPAAGETVTARIDWARRHRLMRMHTCLHVLCSVVDGHVTGGQVSDGKGRLDFNLPEGPPDKEEITAAINRVVEESHAVKPRWITDAELAEQPDLVRTMSVQPPTGSGNVRLLEIEDVDLQPCGGTHVRNTSEIGRISVTKIENKGKQNRRFNLAFAD